MLSGYMPSNQFLRDDGVAEQPAGHYLLVALVQQCGLGYPTQIWSPISPGCHVKLGHKAARSE
jgi:hypothetical protein